MWARLGDPSPRRFGMAAGSETPLTYGRMYRGLVARDAAPLSTEPRPLIVFSHGLRSNRYDLSWLGERLAVAGWLALGIDHPRSTATGFERHVAMRLWERARTLSSAIDALLLHPTWGGFVDRRRIVAAGHSAGGSTLVLLGGGRLDAARFRRYFPRSGDDGIEDACADSRVRSLLLLAPGTGPAFRPEGLQEVSVPVLLFSGTDDWQTPDALCAAHYARHIPQRVWERIPHGGHYTFKPVCRALASVRAPALCWDHPSVTRSQVHDTVAARALAFFAEHVI